MVNNRLFQISDNLFAGFRLLVDLDEIDNMDQIIDQIVNDLRNILKQHKLEILEMELNKKKFHIHDVTFEKILLSEPNEVFWVCIHC
jgi:hypothetical protein